MVRVHEMCRVLRAVRGCCIHQCLCGEVWSCIEKRENKDSTANQDVHCAEQGVWGSRLELPLANWHPTLCCSTSRLCVQACSTRSTRRGTSGFLFSALRSFVEQRLVCQVSLTPLLTTSEPSDRATQAQVHILCPHYFPGHRKRIPGHLLPRPPSERLLCRTREQSPPVPALPRESTTGARSWSRLSRTTEIRFLLQLSPIQPQRVPLLLLR